jgi:peptide-methionine (S)-S-oxide reductase
LLSYEEILQIFWDSHNPTARSWSRQYMSVIFYHNDEQKELALKSKAALEKKLDATVRTEIIPYSKFYLAEDYHQKYYLQGNQELATEIRGYYRDFKGFTDSTAAARLNGLLGGYVNPDLLNEEIESYGLSESGKEFLKAEYHINQ